MIDAFFVNTTPEQFPVCHNERDNFAYEISVEMKGGEQETENVTRV